MRTLQLAAVAMLGCGGGSSGPGDPPTEGRPWLADRYAVTWTIGPTDCAPGGLRPAPVSAMADVTQDDDLVFWDQFGETEGAEILNLQGAICSTGDAGRPFVLRIGGQQLNSVEGCTVRALLPPSYTRGEAGCDDPGLVDFELADACGVLSAEAEFALSFENACAWRSTCVMQIAIEATPILRDPRAPPVEGCPEGSRR